LINYTLCGLSNNSYLAHIYNSGQINISKRSTMDKVITMKLQVWCEMLNAYLTCLGSGQKTISGIYRYMRSASARG